MWNRKWNPIDMVIERTLQDNPHTTSIKIRQKPKHYRSCCQPSTGNRRPGSKENASTILVRFDSQLYRDSILQKVMKLQPMLTFQSCAERIPKRMCSEYKSTKHKKGKVSARKT